MKYKIRTARYGRKVRRRYEEIKSKQKDKYVCPKCGMKAVENVELGIWKCRKCGATFTGGAWVP